MASAKRFVFWSMNTKSFTAWHLIIILVIAHIGGFRVTKLWDGTKGIPEHFRQVYFGVEAWVNVHNIRRNIESCKMNNKSYQGCFGSEIGKRSLPTAEHHFKYSWKYSGGENYEILAQRTEIDGGDPESTILLKQKRNRINRMGTGVYWFIF